jgi:hypothetical protein
MSWESNKFWMRACISITRGSGRGLGPGILEFFWPCEVASSPLVTLTGCILGRSRAHTVGGGGAGE